MLWAGIMYPQKRERNVEITPVITTMRGQEDEGEGCQQRMVDLSEVPVAVCLVGSAAAKSMPRYTRFAMYRPTISQ